MSDRKPAVRYALEDEAAVTGAALVDAESRRKSISLLKPTDLVDERYRTLYEAAVELHRRSLKFSEDTIASLAGPRERWGGFEFLRQLVQDYGKPLDNLEFHVARIHSTRLKADVVNDALGEILRACEDPKIEPGELAAIFGRWQMRAASSTKSKGLDSTEVVHATWRAIERAADGIPRDPGFCCSVLDGELALGLRPGKVSCLGAYARAGKSTLISRMLLNRSLNGLGMTLVTNEAEAEEIGMTMTSAHLNIPYLALLRGTAKKADLERAKEFLRELYLPNLFEVVYQPFTLFDDKPKDKRGFRGSGDRNEKNLRTLDAIVSRSNHPIVVVDPAMYLIVEQKVELFDEALLMVKEIAARHQKHVMLVHHLKRPSDQMRGRTRPTLDLLRGTGGWEQAMDLILLADRPVHRKKGTASRGIADTFEVIIEKQKDAPESHVVYDYDGAHRNLLNPRVAPYIRKDVTDDSDKADPLAV